MAGEVPNKILYNDQVLLDLTGDTATESDVAQGKTFHLASGVQATGTATGGGGTDTSDATLDNDAYLLEGYSAYAKDVKYIGTMPDRSGDSYNIATKGYVYYIQEGYHDGTGTVKISTTEQAKIIASNIKSGVQILGVTGTYTGTTPTYILGYGGGKYSTTTMARQQGYGALSLTTAGTYRCMAFFERSATTTGTCYSQFYNGTSAITSTNKTISFNQTVGRLSSYSDITVTASSSIYVGARLGQTGATLTCTGIVAIKIA